MSENQENQNNIIESYDGDPDDLVFFQTPKGEEYEGLNEDDLEEADTEVIWSSEESMGKEAEAVEEAAEAQKPATEILCKKEPTKEGIVTEVSKNGLAPTGINVNDPHYENYKPDPYYEFGWGPEPEMKPQKTSHSSQEILGVISLSCGIGAIALFCCSFSGLLSLTAIITGIICLVNKGDWNSYKTMSVIGIVLAVLQMLTQILAFLFQFVYLFQS